jgi:hypothetical protein
MLALVVVDHPFRSRRGLLLTNLWQSRTFGGVRRMRFAVLLRKIVKIEQGF